MQIAFGATDMHINRYRVLMDERRAAEAFKRLLTIRLNPTN
jgi:hypothetical protein